MKIKQFIQKHKIVSTIAGLLIFSTLTYAYVLYDHPCGVFAEYDSSFPYCDVVDTIYIKFTPNAILEEVYPYLEVVGVLEIYDAGYEEDGRVLFTIPAKTYSDRRRFMRKVRSLNHQNIIEVYPTVYLIPSLD